MCVGGKIFHIRLRLTGFCTSAWGLCDWDTHQSNEPGAGICFQKSSGSPACFFFPFFFSPFFGIGPFRVLSVKNFSVRKCPNSKGRRGCVRPHWHGSTSWSPSACRHCGTLLSLL